MLLKKAGMVVLGAAAGVAALSGTAFATDSQGPDHGWEHGHHHHHGGDRGDNNSVRFSDDDASPSARGGDQINTGDQLIGLNNTNVQAPISVVASVLGSNIL